eukprot:scaffold109224_cov64-Cyclotella_meneghiniana.AAC.3
MFVAFVHPDHDGRVVSHAIKTLASQDWVISDTSIYYPDFGDSVSDTTRCIIGVHADTDSIVSKCEIVTPPPSNAPPLSTFLWAPFNRRQYAVSLSRSNPAFNALSSSDDNPSTLVASDPKHGPAQPYSHSSKCLYCLHQRNSDTTIQAGSQVMSKDHLCPPFNSVSTENLFRHHFGIEFRDNGEELVRPISSFEFARCFRLNDDLTYKLSQPSNLFSLDAAIPSATSAYVMQLCHERLSDISNANIQIIEPRHTYAPAAMTTAFVNGAIGSRLPDHSTWIRALNADPETSLIRDMIKNPSLIKEPTLQKVHHSLRMPLRCSLLVLENDIIVFREPQGLGSSSYINLRLVPQSLRNIIFVAFHANPIGGHFDAGRTFRNIRLRFFWPSMYSYCVKLCSQCPGCALANRTTRRSSELIYRFPITAPFNVIHCDGFQAGAQLNF